MYATDVRGYVYIIRTLLDIKPYYIGSTREPEKRWSLHRFYGRISDDALAHLCGFIQFDTMKEAYTFEYALHHWCEAHHIEEWSTALPTIVEYAEGIWEEGELNLERLDTVVQTALNRKMLARAAQNFQVHGTMLRSMSELLREIVTIFDAILTQQGTPEVSSTEEANEILQGMFKASLNPGDKYLKSFLKNLQEETGRVEADEMKFSSLPRPPGRPAKWTEHDASRMQKAAEAAIQTPRMQELLKKLNGSTNQEE